MDTKTITVYDNDGQAKDYEILFTYDDEETSISYVFYYDALDEEQIFVSRYDESGHLFPLEDEDEWDKADALLASWNGSSENKETEVCEDCDE